MQKIKTVQCHKSKGECFQKENVNNINHCKNLNKTRVKIFFECCDFEIIFNFFKNYFSGMIGSEYKQELAEEQIKAMKMEASYYREYKKKITALKGKRDPSEQTEERLIVRLV